MTDHTQTKLGIQNSHRSPAKVRRLSPDQLGIPTGNVGDQDEESEWESLRETALKAGDGSSGAAVRTEDGTAASGTNLSKGASQPVHPLELAVWKAYDASDSPVVDVALVSEDIDTVPCGRCLQVLSDYSADETVSIQITDGNEIVEHSLTDLLPH